MFWQKDEFKDLDVEVLGAFVIGCAKWAPIVSPWIKVLFPWDNDTWLWFGVFMALAVCLNVPGNVQVWYVSFFPHTVVCKFCG